MYEYAFGIFPCVLSMIEQQQTGARNAVETENGAVTKV